MTIGFFNEQKDQSAAKARIVAKYFAAWANVMLATRQKHGFIRRLGYIDLFAGPGRYDDGTKSTPLLILEQAIQNPPLAAILATIFNDKDPGNVASLAKAIESLPGISSLKHPPRIYCGEVGHDAEAMFRSTRLCPTFSFIDPFGYKGLSQGFIQAMIKDWGCDCVFFFNYLRINPGLNNDPLRTHMDALFGYNRIEKMRAIMTIMNPQEREIFVLEELANALRALGASYVLPFRFKRGDGSRTTHALVFVTKDRLAYGIMKSIMAAESSTEDEGVPSFTYSPADARCPLLFSLSQPLTALSNQLSTRFAGQTLTMKEVFDAHNIDTPFVEKNYKRVLVQMEQRGEIIADPPAEKRRRRAGERTFGPTVKVTFCSPPPVA